jgi:protein TonB
MKKHFFFLFLSIAIFTGDAAAQTGTDSSVTIAKPEKTPEFKGGPNGWTRFLEKNLNRDVIANLSSGKKYKVVANFLVDADGSVKDIQIEDDPGGGTADELKRILKLSSKQWVPAYDKGQPIAYRHKQSLTLTN